MAIIQQETRYAVPTSDLEEAANFVKTNGITGLNINSDALRLLHCTYYLSVFQIANLLGCHEELVNRKLTRAGVILQRPEPPPKQHELHRSLPERHLEELSIARAFIEKHQLDSKSLTSDHLQFLYHELRLPADAIGQLIGRSSTRVRGLMQKFGIERRDVGEARTGRYNVDFFKQWSPGMAWVTGLLFTDGCVAIDQISLASIDIELLQKVQALLGSDSAVSPNNYKGKAVHRISFGHKELRKDLTEIGLVRRKSLTMKFPEVPEEYVRHFIRGCWDGDGGFSETGGKLYGHYTSGSETFVKRIAIELFKAGVYRTILKKRNSAGDFFAMREAYGDGPYPLTVYKRSQARAFDVRMGTTSQLTPLYELLYKDVDSSIYLSRKRDMLERYLNPPWARKINNK